MKIVPWEPKKRNRFLKFSLERGDAYDCKRKVTARTCLFQQTAAATRKKLCLHCTTANSQKQDQAHG